jgi:hypothetical protein
VQMQGKLNSILFIFSMVLLIPISTVLATSNARDDLGAFETGVKSDRPPINSDFAPDESCLFDVNQLKCVPGSEQECPEGFEINEDRQCHPISPPCPENYHYEDEDESGQCYPNSEGCGDYGPYVLIEREAEDGGDRCALAYDICDDPEYRDKDYCIEYCDENSDEQICDPQYLEDRDANAAIWCDGVPKDYGEELPKLEDDECYGTCEMQSKGLACDIENRQ